MKQLILNGIVVGLLAAYLSGCASLAPEVDPSGHFALSNDRLRLLVPDPTLEQPYYQAQRFTLPGMVVAAEWKGLPIFKENGNPHDPKVHNHVGGTAEEFDINGPAGYDSTPVGGSFMKIGVGLLKRVAEVPYRFSHTYPVVQVPVNTVEAVDRNALKFTQTLEDVEGGRGYRLVIDVRLLDDGFVVERSLTNLGTSPIETEHYSHNFIQIGDKPVGLDYRVSWTTPVAYRERVGEDLRESPTGVGFRQSPTGKFYLASESGSGLAANEPIVLSNDRLGLELMITSDQPVHRLAVFGRSDLICPEPFVKLTAAPGKTVFWKTTYTFSD